MERLSYNEAEIRKLKLRHIFFPSIYTFAIESVIAVLALIIFNASELSNRLLLDAANNNNPLSYSTNLLNKSFTALENHYAFEQISVFLLWAMAGALIYILVFRVLQAAFGFSYSINEGVELYRREHSAGIVRWLGSLHDFFLRFLILFAGIIVLTVGVLVCFGTASQQLRSGLAHDFPSNLKAITYSFIAAILSVRFIVLGISLLSGHFRAWYNEA